MTLSKTIRDKNEIARKKKNIELQKREEKS